MSQAGLHPFPTIILGFGILLGLVAVLDYPLKTRFTPGGIERVCLLRTHRISWPEVTALERAPGSRVASVRMPAMFRNYDPAEREPRVASFGGLAVRTFRRRRFLLVNNVESRDEFITLQGRLTHWAPDTKVTAGQPPTGAPPSWLYRPGAPEGKNR